MKLIDIGVNLMDPSYDHDREEVIKSAAEAGVSPLIITASGEQGSLNAALYAKKYNAVHPGSLYVKAGIHPHDAKKWGDGTVEFFRNLILECSSQKSEKGSYGIVAIGECGLDYNRDFSPRDQQRKCFVKQAELAAEFSLPLFLHERDAGQDAGCPAFEDFSAILEDHIKSVPAVVVHCFTGTGDQLDYYLSLGCYIGITGWICDERRGSHLWDLVKKIPPERLMIETDGPYLFPRDLPFKTKSKRNEPKYLPHITETVARYLDKDPKILASETYENTKAFFGIIE